MEGVAEVVGDLAEDLISGVMAEGVVDLLEAVEVEHEDGEWAVGAAGAVEGAGEAIFEEAAVGEAGEFVVECQPLIAGDLFLEHDEDHADGDEGLLHVPDVGCDVGVGGVLDDPGMYEEAERPDKEAGEDGEASGALAGEAVAEVDGGDEVDGAEAPVDDSPVVVLIDEEGHSEPADEMDGDEDGIATEEDGGSDSEDEAYGDDGKIRARLVDVESVEGVDDKQREAVEGDVEEASAAGDREISGGPVEDESCEEVAVDDGDVEVGFGYSDGGIEDVCDGLDKSDDEAYEPDVGALLRVAAPQHQQDPDEDGQRGQIG